MIRKGRLLWVGTIIAGFVLAACNGGGATVPAPNPGDTRFAGAPLDQGGHLGGFAEDGDSRGAASPSNEAGYQAVAPTDPQREIEEADIVKLEGTLLYALNRYRGLYVIDISNPDNPVLRGHQDLYGYPVEMYIREGRAYVILSNYFRIWRRTAAETEIGSAIVVIDVSNASSPMEVSRYWLPGYVTDTRIVGDVLYGVSNQYSWFRYYYPTDDWQDMTHLLSINIADPDFIHEVDRVSFTRDGGWDNHVHVTTEAIYVATSHYGNSGYETDIRYVDISDPNGQMALGASIRLPGIIRDRWQMDEHNGVFRVVTPESWWGNSEPKVHTFRVNSPTDIRHLASLEIQLPRPESLTACRFDGTRAYVVTYERVDPLFVIDLSAPEQPVQAGELEMPGWLDHIVPRGDRLVAFGHDDTGTTTTLAISLFNVNNVWQPSLIERVDVGDEGEGWGWLTDERDNYDKLFKVLDDEGLILLPYMSCSRSGYWRCQGGVQMVDFSRDDLTKRGNVVHEGYIRRALLAGGRLMTLSDQRLQVLDITDRDAPVKTADVSLSRNVSQFSVVNGAAVQLVGDWYSGETNLVIMPLSNPDVGTPLAEISVDAPYARFFTHGNNVFLLHRVVDDPDDAADDYKRDWLKLTAIDLSDPTQPLVADERFIEGYDWWYYGYYWDWWWWGLYYPRADEAVQAGSALVLHQVRHWSWCDDCENDKLLVVDLADPYNIPAVREIELRNRDWTTGLQVVGNEVRFSHYKVSDLHDPSGRNLVRYYVNRLDVSNPQQPKLKTPVNVPGVLLGSDPDRGLIYTEDYQYNGDGYGFTRSVNVVALSDNHATLRGRVELPENTGRLVLDGQRAWTVKNRWWYDEDTGDYRNEATLQGIDLSDMFRPRVLDEVVLPVPYASLYTVSDGHAVVGTWWYVSGLMVYNVDNNTPKYEQHVQTQGWVSAMTRHGDDLYIATGPYGVKKITFE